MSNNTQSTLGDYFSSSRVKGREGLPLLSVTLNDGLIDRNDLERRTETNLLPEDHLLVRKGDIAFNMMRMWQGAFGLSQKDGLVSPAYIVLNPKKNTDSLYASYLFKTQRMIYLFWAYSYGITNDRLRLYFSDFEKIPAHFPEIKKQTKIAQILSTWDNTIATTERLLANSQQQKQALMQLLLTGHKRFPGFSKDWEILPVGKFAMLAKEKFDPKTQNSTSLCIELEHISQGSGTILGSISTHSGMSTKSKFKPEDILFGKLRPYLRKHWLAHYPGVCSTEIWVLRCKNNSVIPEYLYQLVQTNKFIEAANKSSGTHMPRADWMVVKDIIFQLPCISEQQKIAQVLSTADAEISNLQAQLAKLKLEKKALMQQLLTGQRRVKPDAEAVA